MNVLFDKILLHLIGDETSFKKGTNQILNTMINVHEKVWVTTDIYFKDNTEINNNLLCSYNTSKSDSFFNSNKYYKFNFIETLCSFSKEYFKLYRDLSFIKYNITNLNLLCPINYNISTICGNIGLIFINQENEYYNFLGQLHEQFSLSDYSYLFIYSNPNNDEDIFIFGNKPHVYLPNKFDEYLYIQKILMIFH